MPSPLAELCAELNASLTPALLGAGYTAPPFPFCRQEIRYEFKRPSEAGTQVVAVLFRRDRQPEFSIQLYVEPPEGMQELQSKGGQLVVGSLSRRRPFWPFGVQTFSVGSSRLAGLLRLNALSASQAVSLAIRLLPEVEAWWSSQRSSGHILAGTVRYAGTAA